MAEIADFLIFWGMPTINLKGTGNLTFTDIPCSLPQDLSPLAGGVLAFMVTKVVGVGLAGKPVFDFDLSVNGKNIKSYSIPSGTECALVAHCPSQKVKLNPGANTIRFTTVAFAGSEITISDVVLWFQRNV